ncbi:MAG: hypothetical protein NZL96_01805 [Patescibacteria group bacterium]|nr:hypothetical protein [Patescibacteria group bacterium]
MIAEIIKKRRFLILFLFIFIFLGIFFANLFFSRNQPKKEERKEQPIKKVRAYAIGDKPEIEANLFVEKTGVVTVSSLANGIIRYIYVKEGDKVKIGQRLLDLASNFQGANLFSLQRQIAEKQHQNLKDNLPIQKELISKQRSIAERTFENSEELKDISKRSIDETKKLLKINEGVLKTIEDQVKELEELGATPLMTLGFRQQLSQFQSIVNQLRQGLRQLEYNTKDNSPSSEIASLQREINLKQLDLQERSLEVNLEISRLQYQVALAQESTMFPSSSINGVVERVFVKPGQTVSPGMPLVIVSQPETQQKITAYSFLPLEIIKKITLEKETEIYIQDQIYKTKPYYISNEAVESNLYGVYFYIDSKYSAKVPHRSYLRAKIPLKNDFYSEKKNFFLIPIDAVYQSLDNAFVYLVKDGRAEAKEIKLGQVYGSFVEVEGIQTNDQIILERDVYAGMRVELIR